MAYSDEQHEFIFSSFDDIALIKAYAGTGKSFTLKEYAKKHSHKTFLYFVYNRSMRIDAEKSFKKIGNVVITTFHGIAYRSIGKLYKDRLDREETLRVGDVFSYIDKPTLSSEEISVYAHGMIKTLQDFLTSANSVDKYVERHQKRQSLGDIHDYEMLHYVLNKLPQLWKDITRRLIPADLVPFVKKEGMTPDSIKSNAKALLSVFRDFLLCRDNSKEITQGEIVYYVEKHKERKSLGTIRDEKVLKEALSALRKHWKEISKKNENSLPFEHDFYLKLFQLSNPVLDYDYILVDEAQDISFVMIAIVLRQKQAKKIFVGDEFQSIYSFRGAVNSLNYLERHHSPSVFYLSKSFRCPPKVAWMANRIIKLAGATKEFVGVAAPAPVTKQITYIARTNSSIFGLCVANLDKKIFFVGGVNSYKLSDILDIQNLLSGKHEFVKNDYIRSFPDFKELLSHSKSINDISTMGTIGIVLKYMKLNIYSLIKAIKETATTVMEEADIVVSTAHRSKGLEWAQVELLDDFPFGNEDKMNEITHAQLREELRLLYVAVTRAMNNVKLPQGILEYLEVEESAVSKYLGTVSAELQEASSVTIGNALDEAKKEAEEDYSDLPPIPHGMCGFCSGSTYRRGNIFYCEACDFEIRRSKIASFYKMFKKDFSEEDEKYAYMKMMLEGGHQVNGFVKKDGGLFNPSLVFKKDEKYGWGVGFAAKVYEKKKPTASRPGRGHRKKNSPKPY